MSKKITSKQLKKRINDYRNGRLSERTIRADLRFCIDKTFMAKSFCGYSSDVKDAFRKEARKRVYKALKDNRIRTSGDKCNPFAYIYTVSYTAVIHKIKEFKKHGFPSENKG